MEIKYVENSAKNLLKSNFFLKCNVELMDSFIRQLKTILNVGQKDEELEMGHIAGQSIKCYSRMGNYLAVTYNKPTL